MADAKTAAKEAKAKQNKVKKAVPEVVSQAELPFLTDKEIKMLKEADALGFRFVSVGKKVLFANNEQEMKADAKKHTGKIINYVKKESEWIKS